MTLHIDIFHQLSWGGAAVRTGEVPQNAKIHSNTTVYGLCPDRVSPTSRHSRRGKDPSGSVKWETWQSFGVWRLRDSTDFGYNMCKWWVNVQHTKNRRHGTKSSDIRWSPVLVRTITKTWKTPRLQIFINNKAHLINLPYKKTGTV